jgi:drug/metabolite transporter (DMT)-like permease
MAGRDPRIPGHARQWRDNAVIGTFLLLGGNGLVSWAEQTIPSGMTALLVGAQPLLMVLTEWAWPGGHRPPCSPGSAWPSAFAAWPGWRRRGSMRRRPAGSTWVAWPPFLSPVRCWAFGSIYGRRVREPAETLTAAAMQMLGGGVALMLTALRTAISPGLRPPLFPPVRGWRLAI